MHRDITKPETITTQYKTSSNLDARIALHAGYSTNRIGWHRWVFNNLRIPDYADVLEVGAGTGKLWTENAERLHPGWRLTLTDLSAGMLEKVKENLGSILPGAQYLACDAQRLPFPDASFDAALACHMLYHVPDISSALAEINRVLKPGGILYATTSSKTSMAGLYSLLPRLEPVIEPALLANAVKFTMENGKDELSQHFTNIETRIYHDSLHITDAQPLLDHILSMMIDFKRLATQEGRAAAYITLENMIRENGAIDIQKDNGMFVCTK